MTEKSNKERAGWMKTLNISFSSGSIPHLKELLVSGWQRALRHEPSNCLGETTPDPSPAYLTGTICANGTNLLVLGGCTILQMLQDALGFLPIQAMLRGQDKRLQNPLGRMCNNGTISRHNTRTACGFNQQADT